MLDLDNLIAIHDATDPYAGVSPELATARTHRPQVRRARVVRLQREVSGGTYAVDPGRTAEALVARVRALRSTA